MALYFVERIMIPQGPHFTVTTELEQLFEFDPLSSISNMLGRVQTRTTTYHAM